MVPLLTVSVVLPISDNQTFQLKKMFKRILRIVDQLNIASVVLLTSDNRILHHPKTSKRTPKTVDQLNTASVVLLTLDNQTAKIRDRWSPATTDSLVQAFHTSSEVEDSERTIAEYNDRGNYGKMPLKTTQYMSERH